MWSALHTAAGFSTCKSALIHGWTHLLHFGLEHWPASIDNAFAHTWISFSLLAWHAMENSSDPTYTPHSLKTHLESFPLHWEAVFLPCFFLKKVFLFSSSPLRGVKMFFYQHKITTKNVTSCSSSCKHKTTMIRIWAQMSTQPSTQKPQHGLIYII